MRYGPETFVNYVQLKIVLTKKHKWALQMLDKISPERKNVSAMPLIENLIWEMITHVSVSNNDIKRKP